MWYYGAPYLTVAELRKKSGKAVASLQKKGKNPQNVEPFGGPVAKTFWGRSWCNNLEYYADELNRLERGRRYARAGCVCDLQINERQVEALVLGGRLYHVRINFAPLNAGHWHELCAQCSKDIGSMLQLKSGQFSPQIMERMCDPDTGLFPAPNEIEFECGCPDYSYMCKHVAAALYGIGRRLDEDPELLFKLRGVDPRELAATVFIPKTLPHEIDESLLCDIFDIDLELDDPVEAKVASTQDNAEKYADGNPVKANDSPPEVLPMALTAPPFDAMNPSPEGIVALRELSGLSRAQMAGELGVTTKTLAHWENEANVALKYESLEKLLKFQKKYWRKAKKQTQNS